MHGEPEGACGPSRNGSRQRQKSKGFGVSAELDLGFVEFEFIPFWKCSLRGEKYIIANTNY